VERQKKNPPRYDALRFQGIGWDIQVFARTGRLPADSQAAPHLFRFLSMTDTGRKHRVSWTGSYKKSKLFISAEFLRTTKTTPTKTSADSFLVSTYLNNAAHYRAETDPKTNWKYANNVAIAAPCQLDPLERTG
jgi:hypothetical protein